MNLRASDNEEMEVTLKFLYSVIVIPVTKRTQGYSEASAWEGHPTPENLDSLLHIGKVAPSEAVVPGERVQSEVMIRPGWNILK